MEEQGDRVLIALYDCLWNVAHEDCIGTKYGTTRSITINKLGGLLSTQETRVALGYRLVRLLRFFRA